MRTEALGRETTRIAACWLAAIALAAALLAALPGAAAATEPAWTTYHLDAGRSGAAPAYGEAVEPSRAWQSKDLGAAIWGQPLVLGARVYIATVADTLYALELETGAIVWKRKLGVPVPASALECGDIVPTVGVVGTPVIDPVRETIYAVADTWDATAKTASHVLKGYTLDGKQVLSVPVDPPGADAKTLLQRTALNLDGGSVVFGLGGNKGDCGVYSGAIVSVPETGGAASFWNYKPAPPSTGGGAVWAPSGPAVAADGTIFATTGNPNPPGGGEASTYDFSDSLLRLEPSLSLSGHFEPPSWLFDSNHDVDLGSSGPELLPAGVVFAAGKNGTGYLVDGATMEPLFEGQVCGGSRSFGGDAYSEGVIYIPCQNGVQALSYDAGAHTFAPLWKGPSDAFGPPIVAAGSVWVAATGGFSGGGTKLYALDPATGETQRTLKLPQPIADHFGSPSAAGGKVLIATGTSVTAYDVEDETKPPPPPPAPEASTGTASGVTDTSALLAGTVNPHGRPVTDCRFEYGVTTGYGASVPCEPEPGEGSTALPVSAALAGLAPGTLYHYRLVATGPGGTSEGEDASFKTAAEAVEEKEEVEEEGEGPPLSEPPGVATGAATEVAASDATLTGIAKPEGNAIEACFFQYGPSLSYGSSVPCSPLPSAADVSVAVSAKVTGLAAGKSYQYRLVLRAGGVEYPGANASFTTPSEPSPGPFAPPAIGTAAASGGAAPAGAVLPFASVGAGAAKPVASVSSRVVRVSASGRLSLVVRCVSPGEACSGTITLRGAGAGGRSLGAKQFSVTPGAGSRVRMKVRTGVVARLAKVGSLRVRVAVVTRSSAGAAHAPSAFLRLRGAPAR